MDMPGKLTLEQEFNLSVLKTQVKDLPLAQAQDFVVEVMRQMMVKDNLVKYLLKNS